MISLKAIRLMLKHFDAIDHCVSKRMMRKRPWSEPALTSLLCDLLDQDDQVDEKITYSIEQLNADLAEEDGLVDISFEIETHEYGPDLERWVTQADLGLVLKFDDLLLPRNSWSRAWLLQAKRVSPDRRRPSQYTEAAGFRSLDPDQKQRMIQLRDFVGCDFIRYLLYCPRAEFLETTVRLKLQHLRNWALTGDIFDFALGLQLREDLLSASPTVDAGLFVSQIEKTPYCLGGVYRAIFSKCSPFSWFILSQFSGDRSRMR